MRPEDRVIQHLHDSGPTTLNGLMSALDYNAGAVTGAVISARKHGTAISYDRIGGEGVFTLVPVVDSRGTMVAHKALTGAPLYAR